MPKSSGDSQISDDHYRVTFEDLIESHEEILGNVGKSLVSNEETLRSAIETPYVGYYHGIHDRASALLRGIACNHGFVDGNKRTAYVITRVFLAKSGYRLEATPDEIVDLIVNLVCHSITRKDVADWFSNRLTPIQR